MNEREFINKIESLKSIKPDASWVSLTRDNILGERKLFPVQVNFAGFFFKRNQVFVATATLVLFGGIFFYSHLISSDQRRAEEMERIARQNEVQTLSIALADLKEKRSEMQQSFAQSVASKSREEVVKIARDIAPSLLEMDDKKEVIMGSLGLVVDSEDPSPDRDVASYLIADLEKRSLTEEEKLLLDKAKSAFEAGDYQEALRKVLQIGVREEEKEVEDK